MARTTQERKRARSKADDARESADEVRESGGDTQDGDEAQDGGSSGGVFSELKNVASDAALSVLAPVAKEAASKAAKYAIKKGPELLDETVMPMLEEAGGPKELVGKLVSGDGAASGLLSKLTPGGDDEGGGGDAGDGTGRGRRMPVQQAVDVAAPIDTVYDQWTQFEDYPKFMHRVQRVEQRDESHVAFHTKVWGINRMWEAEIVEQRPDERIVFKSVNGVQLTGVVTFHDLAERLTRIELNVDLDPDGPIEKIARGARFVKRATRGDLKRFKAYVEMHEDETGAWRGEIQDGDVVSEPGDEGYDDEGYEDEEYEDAPEAEYEEYEDEDEDEEEDEQPEAEADSEEEDEDDGEAEDEEEREPAQASSSRSSSSRRRGSSNGGDPKGSSSSRRSRGSGGGGSSSRSKSRSKSSSGSSSRAKSSSGRSSSGKSSSGKSSSGKSSSGSSRSKSSNGKSSSGRSARSKSSSRSRS